MMQRVDVVTLAKQRLFREEREQRAAMLEN
jgi:hypothetical protein